MKQMEVNMPEQISGPSPTQPTPHSSGVTPGNTPKPAAQPGAAQAQTTAWESAFAQLLGPTATPEQISKAMMNMINSMIAQIKQDEKKADETLKKMKKQIEGEDE